MANDFEAQGAAGEPLIPGLTGELQARLFEGAPVGDPEAVWLSQKIFVIEEPSFTEVLPFVFRVQQYLMLFTQPIRAVGGDRDWLQEWVNAHANGFEPHPESRLVKFCRADANRGDLFSPAAWNLATAADIFQFGEVLAEGVVQHAENMEPEVQQYFFQPSTARLESLYTRVFRKHINGHLLPGAFRPILANTDTYIGYERVQA